MKDKVVKINDINIEIQDQQCQLSDQQQNQKDLKIQLAKLDSKCLEKNSSNESDPNTAATVDNDQFFENSPEGGKNVLQRQFSNLSEKSEVQALSIDNNNKEKEAILSKEAYIGTIKEAPDWLVDNEFLLRGYRINFSTHSKIFQSVFRWHNDTVNIWTHLLGAIWVIVLLVYEIYFNEEYTGLTKAPIYILLISQFGMFICSTYLHVYFCKSCKTNKCVLKADYCGIAQLGLGKGFSIIYYALYCKEDYNWIYLSFWTILWSLVFSLSITDKFHQEKYKKYKITLFIVCGLTMLIPMMHILYLGNQGNYNPWAIFFNTLQWAAVLLAGVLCTFFLQFPEKYFPNKFDYVGASHQIWHVCVIIDTYLNYLGVYENYTLRSQQMKC